MIYIGTKLRGKLYTEDQTKRRHKHNNANNMEYPDESSGDLYKGYTGRMFSEYVEEQRDKNKKSHVY